MKADRRGLTRDATAGTVLGLVSVPDGLAAGLLAGLNPLSGLYAYLVGTLAGALTTSSVFMSVQATGAMAVVISDVPQVRGQPDSAAALSTLGLLTGAVMLLAGILRLGTLVRFVPNAVLAGFVNAVAVNIVLGQLADATGFASQQSNRLGRLLDTLLHPGGWHWQVLVTALLTLALILILERTPVGALALVVSVVVASALVAVLRLDDVRLVRDVADIPRALPGLQVPALSHVLDLLIPALALAFVGLVQGAAISQSVPNPDGRYPDTSGDFRGQGIANLAAGLLRGMPVGGSMSGTALVRAAGARSRLANVVAAVVMAVVILGLAGAVGYVAMPSLAALLMLVGFRTLVRGRGRGGDVDRAVRRPAVQQGDGGVLDLPGRVAVPRGGTGPHRAAGWPCGGTRALREPLLRLGAGRGGAPAAPRARVGAPSSGRTTCSRPPPRWASR